MTTKPSVMFVCVHNAGRSQMGAAYAHHLSGGAVEVRSAGSAPAASVNPAVREAMLEEGIDISAEVPKILTPDAVEASDVVITMGCGDVCPYFPGKRYLDWKLDDPAGQGVDAVRPIRDDIKRRVASLLGELGVEVVDIVPCCSPEDRAAGCCSTDKADCCTAEERAAGCCDDQPAADCCTPAERAAGCC